MIAYVKTEGSKINVIVLDEKYKDEEMSSVILPDEFVEDVEDFLGNTVKELRGKLDNYEVDSGSVVYTGTADKEESNKELELQAESKYNEQLQIAAVVYVRSNASMLTDDQVIDMSMLFEEWSGSGVNYKTKEIVRYNNGLYRVLQSHVSQSSWTPDVSHSLFSRIDVSDDGVEVWTQPTDASNSYSIGDQVHYPGSDGLIYTSTVDGNVWSPEAYPSGWKSE